MSENTTTHFDRLTQEVVKEAIQDLIRGHRERPFLVDLCQGIKGTDEAVDGVINNLVRLMLACYLLTGEQCQQMEPAKDAIFLGQGFDCDYAGFQRADEMQERISHDAQDMPADLVRAILTDIQQKSLRDLGDKGIEASFLLLDAICLDLKKIEACWEDSLQGIVE